MLWWFLLNCLLLDRRSCTGRSRHALVVLGEVPLVGQTLLHRWVQTRFRGSSVVLAQVGPDTLWWFLLNCLLLDRRSCTGKHSHALVVLGEPPVVGQRSCIGRYRPLRWFLVNCLFLDRRSCTGRSRHRLVKFVLLDRNVC